MLNLTDYLATISLVIIIGITTIFLFVISKNCVEALIDALFKKKYTIGKMQKLKIPISITFIILLIKMISIPLNNYELLTKSLNSLLLVGIFITILFLINTTITLLRKKWEYEQNNNIESLNYAKRFLWLVFFAVFIVLGLNTWEIPVIEVFIGIGSTIKHNRHLNALAVFVIFLGLANSLLYISKTYLTNMVRQSKTPYDNIILRKIEYPVSWIVIFIGIIISIKQLGLGNSVLIPIAKTIIILIIMHSFNIIVEDILEFWEKRLKRVANTRVDEALFVVAHNCSKIIIVFLALVFILLTWGLAQELKGVLLSLSVMGVVLGIALKETFSNIISGLSLMLDHTFKSNDLIQLESNEMGVVKKIGLRATKLETFDNEILTVPNSSLANSKVLNYTQPDPSTRITIEVGVEYGSNPERVEKILLKVIDKKEYIVFPEYKEVRFEKMDDFSLNFKLIFFVRDFMESFKIKSEVTSEIYKQLRKHKIKIPFPTRTIYSRTEDGRHNKTTKR
ncbi:MAG: mechanosensitive ion channel family protein [Nanobdellota archaeon]